MALEVTCLMSILKLLLELFVQRWKDKTKPQWMCTGHINMILWDYPLVNVYINMENHLFFMGKSTRSMAIFNNKLFVYQRLSNHLRHKIWQRVSCRMPWSGIWRTKSWSSGNSWSRCRVPRVALRPRHLGSYWEETFHVKTSMWILSLICVMRSRCKVQRIKKSLIILS